MSLRRVPFGFTPLSITGCQLWLDGADPAGNRVIPASGTLSTWVDKSGVGNNAIAYTGATAPSFSSATNSITFGTNYYYISGISSGPSAQTLFMVLRRTSAVTNTPYGSSVNSGATWYMNNTDPSFIAWNPYGQGNSSGANLLFYNNVTNVVCGTNSGGTNIMYLNGTADTAGSTSFSSSGIMTIGTSSSGTNGALSQNGFIGTISEVIFYNSVLGTTQRQQVESYLAQKWGATSSLVAGHPGLTTTVFRPDYIKNSAIIRNTIRPIAFFTAFSPRQIPGCALWLDAADSSTVTGTTPITGWTDKSGNGRTVTITSGPTYGTTSQGGNRTMVFNNNTITTSIASAVGTGDFTLIAVWYQSSAGTNTVLSLGTVASSSQSLGFSGNKYNFYQFGDVNESAYSASTPSWVVQIGTRIGSVKKVYINGNVGTTPSSTSYDVSVTTVTIGKGDNFAITGEIGEIMVYTGTMSDTSRQSLESYLAQKWGLTASLPGGHSHLTQQAGAVTTVALSKFKVTGLAPRFMSATGGTVTTVGSFKFHTFTYPGGTFTVTANPSTVQVLVVGGGGGGGGYYNGGGGGAGGAVYNSSFSVSITSYTVTIGNGGAGASGGNNPGINGTSGGASTFSTLTGNGGGGGGADNYVNGLTGGCGGGMGPLGASAPGSGNQGYAGGYGTNGPNMGTLGGAYGSGYGGGGGGGMGNVGSNALTSAGPGWGGTGYTYVVGGQNYLVAGGGGGGTADTDNTNFGLGGSSIGGVGGLNTARSAGNGAANTGSGGGGYGRVGTGSAGGTGGTGIVVIAYRVA